MPRPKSTKPPVSAASKIAGISDAAILKATGKTWPQWLKVLNAAGAKDLDHKGIVQIVEARFGVGDWWCQMVTVGYEQAVLGRKRHSKGGTFEISGSKTINAPIASAFKAWVDPKARAKWLPGADIAIRTATRDKSVRITWDAAAGDNATVVAVNLFPKGPDKCSVQLGHAGLKTAAAGEKMKKHWAARLSVLKSQLES